MTKQYFKKYTIFGMLNQTLLTKKIALIQKENSTWKAIIIVRVMRSIQIPQFLGQCRKNSKKDIIAISAANSGRIMIPTNSYIH